MLFLLELFLVTFLLMSVLVGAGLVALAYFGLAPMPLWMSRYIGQQSTVIVPAAVTTSRDISPIVVTISGQDEYFKKISSRTLCSVFDVPVAVFEAMVYVTNGAKARPAVFFDPSKFCVMREAA